MSEQRPPYYTVRQENTDWNEADAARFDAMHGLLTYPGTVDRSRGPVAYPGDPAQPEQLPHTAIGYQAQRNDLIAEAARAALPDIVTVIRLWPYPQFDLDYLLVLYRTLRDNTPT